MPLSQSEGLTVQFLKWAADKPRTRAEIRDAWSSTCPLNSAWENALCDDLVAFAPDGRVIVTARGKALLAAAR